MEAKAGVGRGSSEEEETTKILFLERLFIARRGDAVAQSILR